MGQNLGTLTKTLKAYYAPQIGFHVLLCDSLGYRELKWVIIVLIWCVSCFAMIGGLTSKNINDVWKVCLGSTLLVYVCFVEVCIYFLDETYVIRPKLVCKNMWVANVRVRLHVEPTRGPTRRTLTWSSTLLGRAKRWPKRRQIDQVKARRWVASTEPEIGGLRSSRRKWRDPIDGVCSHPRTRMVGHTWCCERAASFLWCLGVFGKFTPCFIK